GLRQRGTTVARYKAYDLSQTKMIPLSYADFAVDGCKLPSNASKQWSGTHRELDEKRKKLERVAEGIVDRHRQCDEQEADGAKANDEKKVEKYRRKVEKIAGILDG